MASYLSKYARTRRSFIIFSNCINHLDAFNQFYKNFPSLNPRNRENVSPKPAKPTKEQVKWDAETVEYEEVEEKNQR